MWYACSCSNFLLDYQVCQFVVFSEELVAYLWYLKWTPWSHPEVLRIAEGYQNLCKLQRCRQHVEKSISNEIVLQWSSQESSGWKNPKDSVSFCQSIKDNVLLWCYKIIPTGQRKLKYKRAVRRCGCASSWILRPPPCVGRDLGRHSLFPWSCIWLLCLRVLCTNVSSCQVFFKPLSNSQ